MPTTKKRAIFWQGTQPTQHSPRGFVTNCPQKNIEAQKPFAQFIADKMKKFTSK